MELTQEEIESIGKERLTKEDWKKIRDDGNRLLKDALISAAVFRSTVWMAENQLKNFPADDAQKEATSEKQ